VARHSFKEESLPVSSEMLWEASRWLLTTAVPYFIFDATGVLQHANIAADVFLADVQAESSIHHHLIPIFNSSEECLLCTSLDAARSGLLPGSGTLFAPREAEPYLAMVTALVDGGGVCGIGVGLSKTRTSTEPHKGEKAVSASAVKPLLTSRELEVLRSMFRGCSAREIAAELQISHNTARNHVQALLHKFDAHSKAEAIATALRYGLLSVDGRG
jgi:DNA-binding CsgD family transcriptional regulator